MKLIGAAFLSFLIASATGAKPDGLTVTTQQGNVIGTLVDSSVRQFLGVPYAVAKRWQAPSSPPIRKSALKATNFGDSCIQSLVPANLGFLDLTGDGGVNVTESEDCLSVNVWAPSVARKQKTAVMLWIYGGAFLFGTSNQPTYIGTNFVRDHDDITIVTFNYRLNIFGQPSAPQLQSKTKSQNFGLLDLDAAVQWVHQNIAAFGGDPNRIVIFGQSAGSVAADAYTYAHPHDTIVKGVIEQSGNLGLIGNAALANPAFNDSAWNTVAAAVGCGTNGSAQQFSCMQAVPFRTLENAVAETNVIFNLLVDNITLFSDTRARATAGNFLHVPLMGGSTAHESDIFVVVEELQELGIAPPFFTEVLSDIETLVAFTCPAGLTAQDRLNAKVPTWRYQYQAVFPDISIRPDLRAYHASDIPIVFATYNSTNTKVPATPTEVALSKYVQSAWVAFARDPQQGLVNFGWPTYSPNTPSLAQLGNFFNQTGVVFTEGALLDAACAQSEALLAFAGQLSGGT